MGWNSRTDKAGEAQERGFDIEVNGRTVPGVYWAPPGGGDQLVLLGHGGTTHKKADYILHVAELLAARGISAMAIDGPGHGERADPQAATGPDAFAQIWESGGGNDGMLADWRAALDFIEAEEGARSTGWWGLSMGTMMGLPVCATDERIRVALLGLMGTWGPNGDDLARLAPQLKCPIRFLVQWDDEVVPRDTCLELFGKIGSRKKTMHVNRGKHAAVPAFEIAASVDYLAQKLA